jgi:hypothetical protein
MPQVVTLAQHVRWHDFSRVLASDELKEVSNCPAVSSTCLIETDLLTKGVAERGSNRLGAIASLCVKSGRLYYQNCQSEKLFPVSNGVCLLNLATVKPPLWRCVRVIVDKLRDKESNLSNELLMFAFSTPSTGTVRVIENTTFAVWTL